jgi:serralysin
MATQSNSIPGTGWGNIYIDSLIWGCGWTGAGPITYSFGSGAVPDEDSSIGPFTGKSWTGSEMAAFTTAVANYSAVCGLTFAEASSRGAADIVWWLAPESAMGEGSLGMHEVPDGSYPQVYGYMNYEDPTWSELTPGGYGYITVIHELGHGMGLAHPHDGGDHSDATIFPGVRGAFTTGTNGLNQGIWTTMSYNDGWNLAPATSYGYGYQKTLMAFDIAALQALYGANASTGAGDDSYQLTSSNGSGTGWECIWDAGGTDTISNAGSSLAAVINLNAAPLAGINAGGFVSRDAGILGGYTIANGVTIENAIGGSGADTLVGNAAGNRLDGGAGGDRMSGGLGDDVYIVDNARDVITELAGQGTDTAIASIDVTLAANVENLVLIGGAMFNGTGNSLANTLTGNPGANALSGGNGNDALIGGLGADQLAGGSGNDRFVFQSAAEIGVGGGQRDIVTDWRAGDLIDLSAIDADATQGGDQAFLWLGTAAFGGHAGELRLSVVGRAVLISGDVDGNGVADFELELAGIKTLPVTGLVL